MYGVKLKFCNFVYGFLKNVISFYDYHNTSDFGGQTTITAEDERHSSTSSLSSTSRASIDARISAGGSPTTSCNGVLPYHHADHGAERWAWIACDCERQPNQWARPMQSEPLPMDLVIRPLAIPTTRNCILHIHPHTHTLDILYSILLHAICKTTHRHTHTHIRGLVSLHTLKSFDIFTTFTHIQSPQTDLYIFINTC